MRLLVDTREQRALRFDLGGVVESVDVTTLPVGDYWCEYSNGSRPPLIFERKSLADLYGTMTGGYQRFKREFLSAADQGWKLVLLVEAPLGEIYGGSPHSSMSGSTCVQKVFTLWAKYGLQPVFCQSREESAAYIVETYEAIGRCWIKDGQPTAALFGGMQLTMKSDFD